MLKFKNVEYLVGNLKIVPSHTVPYDNLVCDFISDFSIDLSFKKKIRNYPDIKALSFWCRKKNVEAMKKKFTSNDLRIGLGLIFHITPSNIPTNFAYSLIFGLLSGNSNIVKVPSKNFEQIDIICSSIKKNLKKKKYKLINKMISIIRYQDNDSLTKHLSSLCNARIIWGGDNSIRNIRKFSLSERAIDITFADRYSFCIIDSSKILNLKIDELNRLVEKFYNDTYLVDQNACSSPHLIIWHGKQQIKARIKFWKCLYKFASNKYNYPESASIDKFTQLCKNILDLKNIKSEERFGGIIFTVLLNKLDKNLHNLRGKWGFFYEYFSKNLDEIKNSVNSKYQTLTYFGINKKILKDFVITNNLNGIDRIVPIGQGLDISLYWDGYDINKTLSRIVDIR